MYKTTFKSVMAIASFTLLFAACTKSDEGINFSSTITLAGSSVAADQTNTTLFFSSDNGVTYTSTLVPKIGQKYKVKVMDNTLGQFLTGSNFFSLDWSASNPHADTASSATPGFTLSGGANSIKVTVVDKHCTFDPVFWTGTWKGDEVGAGVSGTDTNHFTQDTSNPNKLTMDNYFGDGVNASLIFSPSTTAYDQTLTMPQQTTSEGGVASGTGTYDQCRGTFTIATTYVIGGSTYKWQYNFHK